jgi:alanyl-tRNA synthetase
VGPDKLTFDFNSAALTPEQVRAVEARVNECIFADAPVSWMEVPYADVRGRGDVMQFFGDKYGDVVRVVQIGGEPGKLDGYSMELCAGTHVRRTGDIARFKIVSEGAIAAGVRRIEAVAGGAVLDWARGEAAKQDEAFAALTRKRAGLAALPAFQLDDAVRSVAERGEALARGEGEVREWEKQQAKAAEAGMKSRAAALASELLAAHAGAAALVAEVADADGKLLQAVMDAVRASFPGPVFLAGARDGRVALIAAVPKSEQGRVAAGKVIQEVAPLVGGKGGGRPDLAQGGGTDPAGLVAALEKAGALMAG